MRFSQCFFSVFVFVLVLIFLPRLYPCPPFHPSSSSSPDCHVFLFVVAVSVLLRVFHILVLVLAFVRVLLYKFVLLSPLIGSSWFFFYFPFLLVLFLVILIINFFLHLLKYFCFYPAFSVLSSSFTPPLSPTSLLPPTTFSSPPVFPPAVRMGRLN